jgi:hypothetical protein
MMSWLYQILPRIRALFSKTEIERRLQAFCYFITAFISGVHMSIPH